MSILNMNKSLRALVEEVRETPGFDVDVSGQHVRVTGPAGTAVLKCGSSQSHASADRDWRKALKRHAGWPPTNVGTALSLAQVRSSSNGSHALQLPPQPRVADAPKEPPIVEQVMEIFADPTPTFLTVVEDEPDAVPAARIRGDRWLAAVAGYLQGLSGKERSSEQIFRAVPGGPFGLSMTSLSPTLSNGWKWAAGGDPFLHVHRRKVVRTYHYWWSSTPREPERHHEPDEPTVPEPAPEPPLVIPTPEPTPTVPEPEPAPKLTEPELFERVGKIDHEVLLRDEHGALWLARRTKLVTS
jgi:hypothetical protein